MSLTDLQRGLATAHLSEESQKRAQEIVGTAIARGGMTGEEREELYRLLEQEEKAIHAGIAAADEALQALEEFEKEVESAADSASADISSIQ